MRLITSPGTRIPPAGAPLDWTAEAAVPTSLSPYKLVTIKRAPTTRRGMMVVWMIPWKRSQELCQHGPGEMSAIKWGAEMRLVRHSDSAGSSPRNRAAFGLSHESKLFEPAHVEIRVVAIQVVKT